jgi:riboflavin synthase
MFSGIVEVTGKVLDLQKEKENLRLFISSPFTAELRKDQSVSHNGICLTVTDILHDHYTVTAVQETLRRTNLGMLKKGDEVNLERCMKIGDRIDGHIVQGHVDCTAACTAVSEEGGSWLYTFACEGSTEAKLLLVEKGSVCVNGVSLTVVSCDENTFSVAIIPYTYEHTNFRSIKAGSRVNIEFDIIGKYVINSLR